MNGLTGTTDRSYHPEQPVRPVEAGTEQKAESTAPVLAPLDDEAPLVPPV